MNIAAFSSAADSSRNNTRPAAKKQKPLGHFDSSDPGGDVHTVCPPEQIIPSNPTKLWWRGDFGGMTLDRTPPLVQGGNTTPQNMVMTFFIDRYDREWQDEIIFAHCEKSYSHFHASPPEDRTSLSNCNSQVQLFQYIQSYGNYVSYWGIGSVDQIAQHGWQAVSGLYLPFLNALQAAGSKTCENTILIVGEELNSCTTPDSLLDIVTNLSPICQSIGIDMWLHFTSNYPAWPRAGQTQQGFWEAMIGLGVKGLCWQSNAYDLAGTMGGHMWDSRKVIPPPGRFVAFETRAYAQLVDPTLKYTEEVGCLTGLEMIYCPIAAGSNILPVAGFGNGGRYLDGSPI